MTAVDIAARLGLHRSGRTWRGACPTCGYANSFVLSQGSGGRAIGWCASCQDSAAIAAAIRTAEGRSPAPAATVSIINRNSIAAEREAIAARNGIRAIAIWNGSDAVPDTPAEVYLRNRCIAHVTGSAALRFRRDTPHPGGGRMPALVAIVVDMAGKPVAAHRTFLTRDGHKANVEPQKATLGPYWGGAIRLESIGSELVIGEGIESSASAGRVLGLPAWAAISAGNLARGLVLPPELRAVVIAADADDAGERAACEAALRWSREGRRVRIARPNHTGWDFNDVLCEREAEAKRE